MRLNRKPSVLLALASAVVLLGAGGLTFWLTSRRQLDNQAMPLGVRAIPADALAVVALASDRGQWQRLRQFGNASSQDQFDQLVGQWRDRLITQAGLDFARDVQPWLGQEVTLALLPVNNSEPGADSPSTLTVPDQLASSPWIALIPIRDRAGAQGKLADRLVAAQSLGDNSYRGITLQQLGTDPEELLYVALLNPDLALVSAQADLVKRGIDSWRGGQSLAERPGFAKAFEQLPGPNPLLRLYLDVPKAVTALSQGVEPPLAPNRLQALQSPRSLAGTLSLKNQKLHLQAVSWLDQGPAGFTTGNQADQMPQRLPASSLLMLSMGDFQQFWQDFKGGQQLSALFPFRPEDLSLTLQSATGLSLEEDFLPWMAGEFGLAVLAPPQPKLQEEGEALPNPALVLMVKTSDRTAATSTLTRLDEVIANRYRFTVDAVDLGGVAVTQWSAPFDSLTLAHGWLAGDILFFTAGQGIAELVAPQPGRSLAQTTAFQATTGDAPRPNNGHFFIDLADLAKAENQLLLPPLPREGLFSVAGLEAMGVTATVLSDRQVRYDVTLNLKRGDRSPNPVDPQAGPSPPQP
ncbi:MAG: DUF3352 domain-containing protein [Nodosilinea sp.]